MRRVELYKRTLTNQALQKDAGNWIQEIRQEQGKEDVEGVADFHLDYYYNYYYYYYCHESASSSKENTPHDGM